MTDENLYRMLEARKENAMHRTQIILGAVLGGLVFAAVKADPPGVGEPPIGCCCLGPEQAVGLNVTEAFCAQMENSSSDGVAPVTDREKGGLWYPGWVDPTTDRTPCGRGAVD